MDKSPSKVLHICQRDDLATGGAARVAVEYVKRLPEYDIDAHCLFLYGEPGVFARELGDRAHHLHIGSSQEFHKFWRLRRFIEEFQPQILHHHDGLLWAHLLTFKHTGRVKVAHAHLGASQDRKLLSRGGFAEWVQRRSTDLLVCITEDTQKSQILYGKYSSEKTCVIRNGVDLNRFYPSSLIERANAREALGLPQDAPVVGFVGRLHCETKGTDDFLRMFSQLPDDFWALVVGDGPDALQLRELADTLGISERIIFTGIFQETVVAYHSIDIFCLTSHQDAFGLVVAEAMACHIPVIGFQCPGGINELLTPETGILIFNRDIKAMAKSIVSMIQNPIKLVDFSRKNHLTLSRIYDWSKNSSQLSEIYIGLLQ